jgi:hypothetical protein
MERVSRDLVACAGLVLNGLYKGYFVSYFETPKFSYSAITARHIAYRTPSHAVRIVAVKTASQNLTLDFAKYTRIIPFPTSDSDPILIGRKEI